MTYPTDENLREAVRMYAAGFRDFSLPDAVYALAGQLNYTLLAGGGNGFRKRVRRALDELAAGGVLTAYPRGAYLPDGTRSRYREYRTPDQATLAEATRYRYFVTWSGQPEREVSVEEWRAAERAAGFHPKLGPGHNATAGFSGSRGISGRQELRDPEDWDDEQGSAQVRSDHVARLLAESHIDAVAMPRLGADGARPGVWINDDDAEMIAGLAAGGGLIGIETEIDAACDPGGWDWILELTTAAQCAWQAKLTIVTGPGGPERPDRSLVTFAAGSLDPAVVVAQAWEDMRQWLAEARLAREDETPESSGQPEKGTGDRT
jgi:hypothetical protein